MLASEHEAHRALEVDRVPTLASRGIEAHDPHTSRLERLQRLYEVSDTSHLHVLQGARRRTADRLGEPGAVSLGDERSVCARRFDRSQDRPEVARVLDPIEGHEKRRVAGVIEQVLEREHRPGRDDGDHTLVGHAAGHAVERLAHLEAQRDSETSGAAYGVGEASAPQTLHDEESIEVPGARAQGLEHRVDAADQVHSSPSRRAVARAAIPSPRPSAPR